MTATLLRVSILVDVNVRVKAKAMTREKTVNKKIVLRKFWHFENWRL
jgi:hypothetical protein